MPQDNWFNQGVKKTEVKKDGVNLIKDYGTLKHNFELLMHKKQIDVDSIRISITPLVEELIAGEGTELGKIQKLQVSIKTIPGLDRISIAREMKDVLVKSSDLIKYLETLCEQLEEYITGSKDNYGFSILIDSSLAIISSNLTTIEEQEKRIEQLEQELSYKNVDTPEQIKERLPPPPIPPDIRKIELAKLYESCETSYQFANLVNPRKSKGFLTDSDRYYLSILNNHYRKFKKDSQKIPIDMGNLPISNPPEPKENPNIQQPPEDFPYNSLEKSAENFLLNKQKELEEKNKTPQQN